MEPGEFYFPIGIAITPADEILVTDHYNNRVQKFSPEGKLLAHFAVLPNPGGIALDKSGNIYLSHFPAAVVTKEVHPDWLTVYSAAGQQLHEWGKSGTGPGEFNYPGGLAIAPTGRLYLADQTDHRIQVFSFAGRCIGGESIRNSGRLVYPQQQGQQHFTTSTSDLRQFQVST